MPNHARRATSDVMDTRRTHASSAAARRRDRTPALAIAACLTAIALATPAAAQGPLDPVALGYPDDTAQTATDSFVRAWRSGDWIVVHTLLADEARTAFSGDVAGRQLAPWLRPRAMNGAPGGPAITDALTGLIDSALAAGPHAPDDPHALGLLFAGVFSALGTTDRLPFDFTDDALVEIEVGEATHALVTSGPERFTLRLDNADGVWRVVQVAPAQGAWHWPDHTLIVEAE